jgi:D-proline reductase (dithiol) PrdB
LEITELNLLRLKNRLYAKILTRFPAFSKGFIKAYRPWETEDVPWVTIERPLRDCKVGIVTTAGVHHTNQKPFDMEDPLGDPTFREIQAAPPITDLTITHDYYDHSDADKDINIVFPIQRLQELAQEGVIGRVAEIHYGLMGHIDGHHVHTLVRETAPEVANRLESQKVNIVLLTPG